MTNALCEWNLLTFYIFIPRSAGGFYLALQLNKKAIIIVCMIVFSTVLDIDGRPTVYNVYKNRGLAFLNPSSHITGPILYAFYQNSNWEIKGTQDLAIKRQVLNEISLPE
jgi:hypothetical protein